MERGDCTMELMKVHVIVMVPVRLSSVKMELLVCEELDCGPPEVTDGCELNEQSLCLWAISIVQY